MLRIISSMVLLLLLQNYSTASSYITTPPTLEECIHDLMTELSIVKSKYDQSYQLIENDLSLTRNLLHNAISTEQKIDLLIRKDRLKEKVQALRFKETSEISKIRYLKGLQIIQILYEKTLSLDHHFSSVATLNEINKISNPNSYPEFISAKDSFRNSADKKMGFDLTSILGNNIYASIVHSVVSLFTNTSASKAEKQGKLKNVECILDFTLRMHTDLNTIYFETAFLQKSNGNVMSELEQLFVDYTKPISYKKTLEVCRNTDDWSEVRSSLSNYLTDLDKVLNEENQYRKAQTMQINLEFPIDRLLQFITQYNAFINQGGEFYEKFLIMLNSYENETACAQKIPSEYTALKKGVEVAVEKFNTAYKPIEINGSKLKEVLYGINEYE